MWFKFYKCQLEHQQNGYFLQQPCRRLRPAHKHETETTEAFIASVVVEAPPDSPQRTGATARWYQRKISDALYTQSENYSQGLRRSQDASRQSADPTSLSGECYLKLETLPWHVVTPRQRMLVQRRSSELQSWTPFGRESQRSAYGRTAYWCQRSGFNECSSVEDLEHFIFIWNHVQSNTLVVCSFMRWLEQQGGAICNHIKGDANPGRKWERPIARIRRNSYVHEYLRVLLVTQFNIRYDSSDGGNRIIAHPKFVSRAFNALKPLREDPTATKSLYSIYRMIASQSHPGGVLGPDISARNKGLFNEQADGAALLVIQLLDYWIETNYKSPDESGQAIADHHWGTIAHEFISMGHQSSSSEGSSTFTFEPLHFGEILTWSLQPGLLEISGLLLSRESECGLSNEQLVPPHAEYLKLLCLVARRRLFRSECPFVHEDYVVEVNEEDRRVALRLLFMWAVHKRGLHLCWLIAHLERIMAVLFWPAWHAFLACPINGIGAQLITAAKDSRHSVHSFLPFSILKACQNVNATATSAAAVLVVVKEHVSRLDYQPKSTHELTSEQKAPLESEDGEVFRSRKKESVPLAFLHETYSMAGVLLQELMLQDYSMREALRDYLGPGVMESLKRPRQGLSHSSSGVKHNHDGPITAALFDLHFPNPLEYPLSHIRDVYGQASSVIAEGEKLEYRVTSHMDGLFRALRLKLHIDEFEFIAQLQAGKWISKQHTKSGAILIFTEKLCVKVTNESEAETLLRIAPTLLQHFSDNPRSLLCRPLALLSYAVRRVETVMDPVNLVGLTRYDNLEQHPFFKKARQALNTEPNTYSSEPSFSYVLENYSPLVEEAKVVHVVIWGRNESSTGKGHLTKFDLKGSTVSRQEVKGKRSELGFGLKDLDFLRCKPNLRLSETDLKIILEEHRKDCLFLAEHNIYDYSTLISVMDSDELDPLALPPPNFSSLADDVEQPNRSWGGWRICNYEGNGGEDSDEVADERYPGSSLLIGTTLYLCVVDILCTYTVRRRLHTAYKRLKNMAGEISPVNPKYYAIRQMNFLSTALRDTVDANVDANVKRRRENLGISALVRDLGVKRPVEENVFGRSKVLERMEAFSVSKTAQWTAVRKLNDGISASLFILANGITS